MQFFSFPLRLFVALFLLAGCSSVSVSAQFIIQSADRVIATVGNEIILASDVESQMLLFSSQSGGSDKLPPNARCLLIDQLLANSLMIAQAERDSIIVKQEEVDEQLDSRIQQILAYMGGNEAQFLAYYGMSPIAMKEKMRDDMRRQMTVQRMQQKATSSVVITPKEVQAFFNRIPKDSLPYFNSEVELAEIIIKPKVSAEEDAKARQTADRLRTQILEDSSQFCALAMEYSNDRGSAVQCGVIGFTPRGQLVPEYEAAAYQLDPMELSDIVKSQYGYHVIQLIQRLGNNINTRHILIRPLIHLEDVELAQKRADSIRTLVLLDSMTFDQAIQKFSEDEASRTRNGDMTNPQTGESFFETGNLDPDVFFAIDGLQIGEMSAPLAFTAENGETHFRIIKIRARTEPHAANLSDDYSRIYAAALEEKRNNAISEWTSRQIAKHAVTINWEAKLGDKTLRQHFADCDFLQKWRTGE